MSWICFALIFTGMAASDETLVRKESNVIHAEEGESVNITCQFLSNIKGLYLKRTVLKRMEVLYATDGGKKLTLHPAYKNRTEYFELQHRAIIMVQQVQKNDSDVYMCQYIDKGINEMNTSDVILAVREKSVMTLEKWSSYSWMMYVIIILTLILVCALGCFILHCADVKKYCWKGKRREIQTIVYEDMNCLKYNNNLMPNIYQN